MLEITANSSLRCMLLLMKNAINAAAMPSSWKSAPIIEIGKTRRGESLFANPKTAL